MASYYVAANSLKRSWLSWLCSKDGLKDFGPTTISVLPGQCDQEVAKIAVCSFIHGDSRSWWVRSFFAVLLVQLSSHALQRTSSSSGMCPTMSVKPVLSALSGRSIQSSSGLKQYLGDLQSITFDVLELWVWITCIQPKLSVFVVATEEIQVLVRNWQNLIEGQMIFV